MVKLYKFSGYYVDWNGNYSINDVKGFMDCPDGSDLFPEFLKIEEAIIDVNTEEDYDNLDINKLNCPEPEYEKYFMKEQV